VGDLRFSYDSPNAFDRELVLEPSLQELRVNVVVAGKLLGGFVSALIALDVLRLPIGRLRCRKVAGHPSYGPS
jgi:hypothetical protein